MIRSCENHIISYYIKGLVITFLCTVSSLRNLNLERVVLNRTYRLTYRKPAAIRMKFVQFVSGWLLLIYPLRLISSTSVSQTQ